MEIVFSHRDFVIIEKPVGMDSEKDVPNALIQQLGGAFYTVHRLDLNVGGLMVYARNSKTAALLSKQIAQGQFIKEYVALVHGTPPAEGDWTDLLFKDSRKNKVFLVDRMRAGVKEARLSFRLLWAGTQSLVRVRLYTGRSHQIRAQFSGHGFALVGDHKYGSRAKETEPRLYSCSLRFFLEEDRHFEKLPPWAEEQ